MVLVPMMDTVISANQIVTEVLQPSMDESHLEETFLEESLPSESTAEATVEEPSIPEPVSESKNLEPVSMAPFALTATPEETFTFVSVNGGVQITGFVAGAETSDVNIPDTLGGQAFVSIADRAFMQKAISSVTLGTNLKTIGEYAFAANQIATLIVPNNLEEIGAYAFRDNLLKTLDTNNVKTLRNESFANNQLSTLTLKQPETIGNSVFINNNLQEVAVPSTVQNYGSEVFAYNDRYVLLTSNNVLIKTEMVSGGFGQVVNPVIVTVHYIDEATGAKILDDQTWGDDFSRLDGLVLLNQENTYQAPAISNYHAVQTEVKFTPDQIAYELNVNYRSTTTKPSIELLTEPKIAEGGDGSMAVLLSFVKATDLEGTDISGSITVEPTSIDTSIPGPVNVTYSVTDKLGNTSTRTVSVLVGTDWYTFPLGNGWVLGDFTYEGNKVNGFTEQGLAKVSTVKDLILPHINPADGMTVIDTVGANAVDASSFRLKQLTSVADYANNIRRIDGRYSATSAGERDPGAFSNNLVNTIDLPNLEYVGREGFSRNRLTAVSFPNLKFLGSTAFGYNQITNIDFPKVEFVDVWGLGNNQITEVIMPSLQTIDNAGFINNQIASISLPKLTTIMSNALANNKLPKLEQADIPKLTVIGDGSFRNNLISYLDLPNIIEIQARGLQNNVLASTAPAGLSSLRVIGIQAFQNNQIVELAIPNLASVGTLAFDINPGSPTYSNNVVIWTENNQVPSLENYLVNPSQDALVLTWLEEDFVWDANDTGRILGFSSSGKQKLPDMAYAVSFPDRATSIAPRAFFSLKLTSVTGKNVTDLGNSAFEQNSISSAVFPNLQTIGSSAFRNNQLTEFDFSHVVSVGSNAFRTNKLTSVDLPLVTDIGDGAFMSNTIKDLSAENVINIASQAFASQPIESLFLPKVKTIGNSAFSGGKLLKTVDLPVVESIGVSAFADNIINSLSLPQVKTLGNTAFNTNRLTSIDLPMIETLGTQAFRYNRLVEAYLPLSLTNLPNNTFELNRTYNGLNREVMVFFPGGENPNNLQDGFINNVRQHIVNPTKVTIHYVDEAGNPLAESITEYIFAEKTYPAINIFNYKENKLSITVPDNRKPNEEFFVYEKLALEGMHTNGVEIYQLNEIDRNTTLPKTRYYIGDKMITRVYADLTGFNAAINNGKINIYYDPAFIEPSSIKIPTSTSIKSFKVNNGVIEVLLNPIAGSYNLEIPIEWRFKKYVTPDNYQMEINALFAAGDTVYSVAEPIYLEGYYNKPMMTKRSPLNIPDYDYGYSNSATNGPRLIGEMSLAKLADNTYDYSVSNAYPVEFSFGINNLERYVSEAIVTDTLPTYIALDANGNEEIRTAVFDYDLNPGWILSNDGKTVTQHAIFAKTLFPGSSIKPLYLTFPGLKSGYNVMNNVQVELIPDKIGLKEKSMFVQDDISIYAFKFEPVKYEGDPRFDKDDNKAPWYNGGMAYFYDVQADREKIIPFFLRTSSMATLTDLVDLRITDYALDDRLYYYGLSFPQGAGATGNLPVTIVAYSQVGAIMQPSSDPILQSVTTTMNTSNHVVFDAGIAKNIDYIQIILPASHKVFSALEFVVETKLREPDKTHYTPSPLSGNNVFHNHAVMSGNLYLKGTMVDASVRTEPLIGSGGLVISEYTTAWDGIAGNYLWHEQAFVTIRDYAVDMGVGKTQTYPSTENVYPGQEGSYSLRVRPFVSGSTDEFEGMSVIREKLHDFEMVDLLPNGLSVTKITLSDGFKASEESSYRIVENYGRSGQRAIVFTAKTLNEGVFNIATIDTIVDPETEEGQVTNQVFLTFENPSVRKVGNKLSPPGEGGDGRVWIQDQKVFNLLKVKELFARKYIRKTGDLAWSPIGIQTESEGSFDYRLSLINNLDQPRSKIDIVDFFPYLGDVSIQEANIGTGVRPPRESKFMNTFDTNRDVIVPNGYTVSYWNSNTPPVYPASGNRSADAYIASLTWSSSPAANTRGIRITATEGVVLEPGMRLDVIVPMLAPANTVDNDFNLTGLRAYNTFVRKDDFAIRFLEPNRVYNEIPAPLGSITFTKWAQDSVVIDEATQYQLQGAEFELRDKEGNFVAKAVSDADGKVKFVDLPILNTYTIKETKAPQGFTLSTKTFSVNYEAFKAVYDKANETFDVVLSDRVSKDNFLNIKPFYGTFSLEKVNERGEHLAYIRFNITGLDEWNKTFNQNFLTGTNGLISITRLLEGRYLLTELSSSNDSGFVAIEPIEFAITKDAPDVKFLKENGKEIVNQNLRVLINKLAVGSDFDIDASIRDLTDFGLKKLDGYSFIITDTSDNSTITTGPTVNGRVAIEGLKIDTVYTISEVKKDGTIYAYNASQYRFKINSLGKIVDKAGLPFRQNMLNFPIEKNPCVVK